MGKNFSGEKATNVQVLRQERAIVLQRLKQDKTETGRGSQAGPAKHRKEVNVISAMRTTNNFRAGHRCALGPEWRSGLETSARGLLAGRGAQEEGGGGLNKGEAVDTIR